MFTAGFYYQKHYYLAYFLVRALMLFSALPAPGISPSGKTTEYAFEVDFIDSFFLLWVAHSIC